MNNINEYHKYLSEIIIKRLANGFPSDDFEIEEPEIVEMIMKVQNSVIVNNVTAAVRSGDFEYANMFTKIYERIVIGSDNKISLGYMQNLPEGTVIIDQGEFGSIEVPAQPTEYSVSPLKIKGLPAIHNITIGDDKVPVYPIRGSQSRIKGVNTYSYANGVIKFYLDDFDSFLANTVNIELIPSAESILPLSQEYPADEYVLMPEIESQVIEMVVNFYKESASLPKDKDSDGAKIAE